MPLRKYVRKPDPEETAEFQVHGPAGIVVGGVFEWMSAIAVYNGRILRLCLVPAELVAQFQAGRIGHDRIFNRPGRGAVDVVAERFADLQKGMYPQLPR